MIKDFNRNLIVAAHPDDEILGCGGLMHKLIKNKKKVKVIFIAEGSSCRFNENNLNYNELESEIKKREKSAKLALADLGVKNFAFYNLMCGKLNIYPIIEIAKIVEKEIKIFKPDTIFTHSDYDVNYDHKTVFQACLQATRPVNLKNIVKKLYSFEILSSSEWRYDENFKPNTFIDINKEFNKKIKALRRYKNELRAFPHPRSVEGVKVLSKLRGSQSGLICAEAFKLIRAFD